MVKLNGVYSPTDLIKGFIPQNKIGSNCEGSGNCCDCNLWDCYYNDTINPDTEDLNWNAEMDIMEAK